MNYCKFLFHNYRVYANKIYDLILAQENLHSGPFRNVLYLNVASDNLYQKMTQKLKLKLFLAGVLFA